MKKNKKIKWGIIGPGNIAHNFAQAVESIDDATIVAVASRNHERGLAFAKRYNIDKVCSYQELVESDDIDLIYIATPHNFHYQQIKLCLEHNKGVLCEKPICISLEEFQTLAKIAAEKKLFLMEAMWTRFLPMTIKAQELINAGAIGEPQALFVDFAFRCKINPENRLFKKELAGGALYDVGVYCVAYAQMLFGEAQEVKGVAQIGETGIDEQNAAVILHKNGKISSLFSAVRTGTHCLARIQGTAGEMIVEKFWGQPKITLKTPNQEDQIFSQEHQCNGFEYEIIESQKCFRAGKLESSSMTWQNSEEMAKIMEELRTSWQLFY